jgi:hypothetical protein
MQEAYVSAFSHLTDYLPTKLDGSNAAGVVLHE